MYNPHRAALLTHPLCMASRCKTFLGRERCQSRSTESLGNPESLQGTPVAGTHILYIHEFPVYIQTAHAQQTRASRVSCNDKQIKSSNIHDFDFNVLTIMMTMKSSDTHINIAGPEALSLP